MNSLHFNLRLCNHCMPLITNRILLHTKNHVKCSRYKGQKSDLSTDKYWMYKFTDKINSPVQKFRTFFVIDFEATCDSVKLHPQEIIEFPCLKLNGKTLEVESAFHEYVRPVVLPKLSPFCVQLTGITQDIVDKAAPFSIVWNNFNQWLIENKENSCPFVFVCSGSWDLQFMLPQQLAVSRQSNINDLHSWIDLKKAFAKGYGRFPFGLKDMLRTLNLPHLGKLHSGIDDCVNIVNVVKKMIEDKIILDVTDHLKRH